MVDAGGVCDVIFFLSLSLSSSWLMQVVFATETLAAGINMPARTTVISTLSRRRDVSHSALLHNELLQMAGRAGRRGFDTAGQPAAVPAPCNPSSQLRAGTQSCCT